MIAELEFYLPAYPNDSLVLAFATVELRNKVVEATKGKLATKSYVSGNGENTGVVQYSLTEVLATLEEFFEIKF